jgi:hypothetical protein
MISNSALLMLCRVYRDNPDSLVLKKIDGLTPAQGEALERLIDRERVVPDEINIGLVCEPNVLMLRFGTLWIGVETDGYAHS